jgi:predicted PurR-regulated permease PerM
MDVSWRSLVRIVTVVALVWLWLQVSQVVLVLIVATMLAVALDPVVEEVERIGLNRSAAVSIVSVVIVLIVGVSLWATWTSLADQATFVSHHLQQVGSRTLARSPQWIQHAVHGNGSNATSMLVRHGLTFAESVVEAVTISVLGFIVTVYLLIEGGETRDWILAFVPAHYRSRVHRTLTESRTVIFSYVKGNVITSVCATVFMLVAFVLLHVPAALLLAVMTGVFDVVPVVGSIVPAIPAVLLALTVSPMTALLVIVAHVVYNAVENYFIAPWAYGGRLHLSNLAVILAMVVGGEVAGVIGAVIALPIAALYPSIERSWLRSAVGDDTVQRHRAISRSP